MHRVPLSRRDVYDYLLTCSPVGVDVTLLSVADRLATRGDNAERAIDKHVALARMMLRVTLEELLRRARITGLAGEVVMTRWPEWGVLSAPVHLERI